MTVAQRLHIRLFLEGIEVPVVAAKVTCGIAMPSQAAVQIIATDAVHDMLPRTLVHLFYLDPDHEVQSGLEDEAYKLFFAGESLGYRFVKSRSGRQGILLCTDFSSYWDAAKLYFRKGGSVSADAKSAAFTGATMQSQGSADDDETQSAASIVFSILKGSPSSIPGLNGMLGGLIHMLETIGGLYKGGKSNRGINDFFSCAELRLKLAQMLGASAKDTSSLALFKSGQFRKWIEQTIGKRNALTSFRQILELLLQRIFHQYTSVPTSHLRKQEQVWVTAYRKAGKSALPPDLKRDAEERLAQLQGTYDYLSSDLEPSPMQSVDHATENIGLEVSGMRERTGDDLPQTASNAFGSEDPAIAEEHAASLASQQEQYAGSNEAASVEDLRKAYSQDARYGRAGNALAEQGATTGLTKDDAAIGDTTGELLKTIDAYKSALTGKAVYRKTRQQVTVFERLIQHVFSPDIWYASPPRPNIIFPDQYFDFSFSREFMSEVTRLQLSSKAEKGSILDAMTGDTPKQQTHWAPLIPDVYDKLSRVSAKAGARFIMPHEIFGGIVPRFDSVPDIEGFRKVDRESGTSKIPYLQRIANYLLYKYRYGPRTGSLSMGFTPRLIPGFPCVVVDRYTPDNLQKDLGIEPIQYVGVIHRIEHDVSQEGGTTRVLLTHLRNHKEQATFLGGGNITILRKVGTKKKKHRVNAKMVVDQATGTVLSVSTAAAVSAVAGPVVGGVAGAAAGEVGGDAAGGASPDVLWNSAQVGDTGPSGGKITEVNYGSTTETMANRNVASTVTEQAVSAVAGPLVGGVAGLAAGTATSVVTGPIDLTEEVGIYKEEKVSLPLEEVVRPPWVSPIYNNVNIGPQFYTEMFGCLSLTDPLQVMSSSPPTDVQANAGSIAESLGLDVGAVSSALASGGAPRNPLSDVDPNPAAVNTQLAQTAWVAAEIKAGRSISQAIDGIVKAYRELKSGPYDAWSFVHEFTKRPVASLPDVLGSSNLEYSSSGEVMDPKTMTEGFHSRAFGSHEGLALLDHKPSKEIGGEGKLRTVDAKIDPRKPRWDVISRYADALRAERALVG